MQFCWRNNDKALECRVPHFHTNPTYPQSSIQQTDGMSVYTFVYIYIYNVGK